MSTFIFVEILPTPVTTAPQRHTTKNSLHLKVRNDLYIVVELIYGRAKVFNEPIAVELKYGRKKVF